MPQQPTTQHLLRLAQELDSAAARARGAATASIAHEKPEAIRGHLSICLLHMGRAQEQMHPIIDHIEEAARDDDH